MTALTNRLEFVYLFDVTNGNPNGDPDAANMPRMDPETRHGLVTDVCLKRKIRNYVLDVKNNQYPHEIYVCERAVLNKQHERAYNGCDVKLDKKKSGKPPADPEDARRVTRWMCDNFFDIRTFGAVMSTNVHAGQVRGPVQLAFSQSLHPVQPISLSITRMAVTTADEAAKQGGANRTMGEKWIIPYGLYRCHGFVSAHLAGKTGFDEDDLTLLFTALMNMFDHDRSASRGEMAARGLYVFRHDNSLGNAPAHKLFDLISVVGSTERVPRIFSDYQVTVNEAGLPPGVTLARMIE
jgi:CRISPR-associated protein Csd2